MEVALYFVASEAVNNAVKHAGATRVEVVVAERDGRVELSVSDDGAGGADPAGPGLSGLARRVLAADGVFGVDSPAGGPAVVRYLGQDGEVSRRWGPGGTARAPRTRSPPGPSPGGRPPG